MDTLDDNREFINQADVPYRSLAMRYGLIAAMVFIAITLLVDTLGLVDYANGTGSWISSTLQAIATLAILYYAIKQHRDQDLGGYISFGRCISIGALIGLIAGVLIAAFAFVYYGYIRPDIMTDQLAFQREKMLEQGMDEAAVEQAMSMTESFMSPAFIAVSSIISSLIFYTLFSLIVGAIMKRKSPMA